MAGLGQIAKLGMPAIGALAGLTQSEEAEAGFGGMRAKMADAFMASIAHKMEGAGATPQEIFEKTRFFRGKDNKWRFEYDDDVAELNPDWEAMVPSDKAVIPLKQVYSNPNFEANYPDIADELKFGIETQPNVLGSYNRADRILRLNPTYKFLDEDVQTILHEAQHAIQQKEGFSKGGNQHMFQDVTEVIPAENPLPPGFRKKMQGYAAEVEDLTDQVLEARRNRALARRRGDEAGARFFTENIDKMKRKINKRKKQYQEGKRKLLAYKPERTKTLTAQEQYKRLYGEAEARNVEKRYSKNKYIEEQEGLDRAHKNAIRREHPHSTMDRDIEQLYARSADAPGLIIMAKGGGRSAKARRLAKPRVPTQLNPAEYPRGRARGVLEYMRDQKDALGILYPSATDAWVEKIAKGRKPNWQDRVDVAFDWF